MRVGEAFLSELVNVRRLNNLVPHKAVIRPRLVIGNDVNNIGRLRVTESGSEGGKENPYTLHAQTVQQVVRPLQAKRLEETADVGYILLPNRTAQGYTPWKVIKINGALPSMLAVRP